MDFPEMNPKIEIPESVVSADLGNELVLLDLATGTYFGLDEVGLEIWKLISQGQGLEQIVQALLAQYEVGEADLRRDVESLLAQLADKGLVKAAASEPSRG